MLTPLILLRRLDYAIRTTYKKELLGETGRNVSIARRRVVMQAERVAGKRTKHREKKLARLLACLSPVRATHIRSVLAVAPARKGGCSAV